MHILTKSRFITGLKCPKLLWINVRQKELLPLPNESTKLRFEEGNLIGEFAKKLFPEGIDLPIKDFNENLKKTKESLKLKKPLFEPGFKTKNCFCRGDILVPINDSWDIIEVKSSTEVKKEHYYDLAFQKYCCEKKELKIRKCYLMCLNKEYVRKGKLDLKKLFVKNDITDKVNELIKDIDQEINIMLDIINQDTCPKVNIESHCNKPYPCPITECLNLSEKHVYWLYRGKGKSIQLLEQGIENLNDIPETFKLTDKQHIQKECVKNNKIHINKENIKKFLKKLKYPLYFLDFETFQTAIPMFDGLKPYSNICFQYSLHIKKDENSEIEHHEFLYNKNKDPRKDFLNSLKKVIGDKGTVIVYNKVFEISRLKELAKQFPEHNKWIENVIDRIEDLLEPFKNFDYYNPIQKGSASIKKVLPAITKKDYKDLEISDGGTASVKYYIMTYKNGKDVRKDLLEYCKLDTWAEVLILNELKKLVN